MKSYAKNLYVRVVLAALLVLCGAGSVYGADYVWTGGGGADTRWTNPANWGEATNYPGINGNLGNDIATIGDTGTPALITFDSDITVTDIIFDTANMVTLDLHIDATSGYTLTVSNYMHLGRSSGDITRAANLTLIGHGRIATQNFDTNQDQTNSLTLNNYVELVISGTMYGNSNTNVTNIQGDGTGTITTPPGGANTQYGIPAFTVSGVTVVSSNMTFSYTPAPGAGLNVTLTANGRFPTNVIYRTPSYYLTRTGAEVWYLNNTTGTDQRAVTYNAFTALPWTPASDNEAFSFRIDFPGTIANGNGIVFDLYQNDRFSQIGTIQYTQGECFWIGEAASGIQTDWDNPLNWSTGLVPDATEDVRIPATTNKPVLSTPIQTGSVLIQNGASLSLGGNTLDIGAVTVENGGTLNLNTGRLEVDSVTIDGTGRMNAGSGTVLFTGAASWNCDQPLYSPLYNLEIDSGATLTANNALFVAGNWVNGGTFTHNSRAVTFSGTANQTVTTGGDSFHTVSITNTGGAIIASGNLTLAGNLSINSGADLDIATNSSPLSVGGTATINGTLTAGTANMTFTGGGSNAGTVTLTGSQTIGGTVLTNTTTSLVEYTGAATPVWGTAYGDLTVSAGTLSVSTGLSCNDLSVTATGTVNHTASNTITASGAVSILGSWTTPSNSALVMTGSSTLDAVPQLGALTVNNSNTVSLSGNDLSLAGALLIGNGSTLSDAADLGLTVAGTTTVNGTLSCGSGSDSFAAVGGSGTWNVSTGTTSVSDSISTTTVSVTGGTMTLSGGTHGAYSFNDLEIDGAVISSDAWTINGNLLISSGSWTAGAHSHEIHGNWTNNVGAGGFSSTGTVSFVNDAAGSTHSLTGETSFYNLTSVTPGGATGASTLSFPASTTTTVSNNLDLRGIDGYRLNLVSSNLDTQWTLSAPVTQTLDWLAVNDSIRTNDTGVLPTNSTSANSTGWGIAQIYTWSAAAGIWSDPTNWSPNGVPGAVAGDSVIINSGNPTVDAAPGNALASISLNGGTLTLAAHLSATDMAIGDGAAAAATVMTGGFNLSVSGTFALDSDGLLVSNGTGTISVLDSVAAGSIVRYVAGGGSAFNVTTTGPARNYENLEVTGGNYTVADPVSAVSLSLSGTGTYNFNGDLDVTGSFSTTATAFNLAITGNGSTITPNATFNNTGTLALGSAGNAVSFSGDLIATDPSAITVAGTITAVSMQLLNATTDTLTLDANTTLATGGAGTIQIASAVTDGANSYSLTLGNTGQTGAISVSGPITLAGLATANEAFDLRLLGDDGTPSIIDGSVTFTNTGTLQLGDTDTDDISFTAGLTANGTGTNSFRGNIATGGNATQNILLDDLGISGGTLVLEAGAAGTISVTGATTGTGFNLSIANSNGASFDGAVGSSGNALGTVTITDTSNDQTVAFDGGLYAATLSTAAQAYNLSIGAGAGDQTSVVGSLAGGTAGHFNHNGTLVLGNTNADSVTFTNGVVDAASVSGIQLAGTIASSDTALNLNDTIILNANTTLSSGTGDLTAGGTVNSANTFNYSLELNSSGTTTVGAAGATDALLSLTTDANGSTSLQALRTTQGISIGDNVTVNGTLTVSSAGYGVTLSGTTTLAAGSGTITLTGDNADNDITFTGAVNGAQALNLTATGGDILFSSTVGNSQPVAGITASAATTRFGNNVRTNGGNIGITGNLIANAALTINTNNTSDGTLSIASGTLTATVGDLTLDLGTSDFTAPISSNIGTVIITSVNDITLNDTNGIILGASSIAGDLDVNAADGAITQSGAVSVAGTTTLTAFNGVATYYNITLDNTGNDFDGTVTATGANITLTDTDDITLGVIAASGTVAVTTQTSGTSTITVGDTISTSSPTAEITLDTAGGLGDTIILSGGGFTLGGGSGTGLVQIQDNAIINSAGTITLSGGSLQFDGSLTRTLGTLALGANPASFRGNILYTAGSISSTGTLTFDGTAQTADFTGSTLTNVTVGNGVDPTALTLESNLTLSGTLSISANATLTALDSDTVTSRNISTASWTNNGGFTAAAGTVTFSGTGTLGGSTQTSFATVHFDGVTSFTQSFAATTALAIDSNDSTTGTRILSDGGTNLVITVGGDWTNNDVFTAGDSTVVFTDAADHIIAGSTTFYNLTMDASGAGAARTLTFTDGTTQTIAAGGSLTLLGASGRLLTLGGSGVGGWTIDLQNTAITDVQFVDVSYGNADTNSIAAATSRDSGNNDSDAARWVFTPASIRWTGADSEEWGLGTNWEHGYVPNVTDNVIFQTAGVTTPLDASGLNATTARVNDVTITGGTIDATGAGTIWVDGSISVSGTPAFSSAANLTWDMRGSSAALSGVASINIGNIRIDPGATNSITLGTDTQVNNLELQSGTLAASTHTLSIRGNISDNTNAGELTFTSGTLTLNGSANTQIVDLSQATLNNLTLSNTFTPPSITADSAIVVSGSLSRTAGNLVMGAFGLSVASDVTHTAGTLSSSGTIMLNGSALQDINLDGASIQHLELDNPSGANLSNTATFTWGGNAILTAGALRLANLDGQIIGGNISGGGTLNASLISGANTLSVNGYIGTNGTPLATLSAPAGTLVVGSDWNVTSFTHSSGTVRFAGSGTLYTAGGNFNNVGKYGAATNTAFNDNTTILGIVHLEDGELSAGTTTLISQGSITRNTGVLTFTGAGTLRLAGTGATTVALSTSTIRNLDVTNTNASGATLSEDCTVNGNLTVNAANRQLRTGGNNLTVTGNTDLNGGILDLGNGGTLALAGNLALTGSTISNITNTTLRFNSGAAQNIINDTTSKIFNTIEVGTAGSAIVLTGSLSAQTLDIADACSFTVGSAAATASSLSLSGTGVDVLRTGISSGGFRWDAQAASASLAFTGVAPQINNGNASGLQVSNSINTASLSGASAANRVSITGSALDLNGRALSLSNSSTAILHSLTVPGSTLNLSGSNTFSGGLTVNNGTAAINTGTSTLSASTLTAIAGTITIDAGNVSASGALTINGGTLEIAAIPSTFSAGSLNHASGIWNNTATNTLTVGGNVVVDGSFNDATNSRIIMNGPTPNINTAVQIGHLEITTSAAVSAITNQLRLAGNLSLATGTSLDLDALGADITGNASGSGTASLDGGSAAVNIGGNFEIPDYTASSNTTAIAGTTVTFGTLTHSSGTISLNGTTGPVILTTSDELFNNLSLSSTAAKTVNVTGELTTNASLNVGTNCLLAVGNNELNVGTTTTNTGSITLGTQTASFTGLVTNTSGSITGGAGTLTFTGGISNGTLTASENDTFCGGSFSPASFTHSSGDLILNGTTTPVALAGANYNNLFLVKTATATINASGTVTVAGTLDVDAGNTLAMAANQLSVTSTTDNAGTISSSGAGTQTYTALVTNTGSITGAGLITLSGGITGSGTTTAGSGGITSAATATFTGGTLDINGSNWVQSAGNLVLGTLDTPADSTISFTGSIAQGFTTNDQAVDNVSMNMNPPATTLTITGNLNQSANSGTLTLTRGTLVMGGNTLSLGADLAVPANTTLSVADGTLTGGAHNISVTGGTLTLSGTTSLATTGTFAISGTTGSATLGTGDFSTGAMSLTDTASFIQSGDNGALFSQNVASLDVGGGTTCEWDDAIDGGSLDIVGNVTANGTLAFNNKNVRIGGSLIGNIEVYDLHIPAGRNLSPAAGSSITVRRSILIDATGNYNGSAAGTSLVWGGANSVNGGTYTDNNITAVNLGTLQITGTQNKTLNSHLQAGSLEINGPNLALVVNALTVDTTLSGTGSLTATGSQTIAIGGSLSLATVNLGGSSVQLEVGGSMSTPVASFTAGNSTVTFNGNSNATMLDYSFHNLIMNMGAASTTLTPSAGITVANTLTLTQGDFRAGNYTHNIAGNWNSSAVAVTWNAVSSETATIRMTTTNPTITTKAADSFYNLTLDVGGIIATSPANGTLTVRNNFTAANLGSGGTLTMSVTNTLAVAGDVNLAPGATGATLTANNSTLSITGAGNQTVTTNNQTWYNLAIGARAAGNTVSFSGELNASNATVGLTTGTGAYDIEVNDGGTVANNVTFANTGTLILNTADSDTFTATGGLTATAPSSVSIAGNIVTNGTDMALGSQAANRPVILAQDTSLSTGALAAGTITLGPVDGGATARSLEIIAGSGDLLANGELGATNDLDSLTLSSAGNASFARGISSIGTINLNNSGILTLADPEGDADTATVNISSSGGNFVQTGASRVDVAADFSIAGTTSFARPVQLVGNVAAALTGPATFGAASTIDSAPATAWSLAFTGNGTRNFNAAIGSATAIGDLSLSGTGAKTFIASVALDSASGDLTVDGSMGLVHFQDTFAARSASQTNGANPIRFDDDVTLGAGNSGFYGNVTLDGLVFSSAGPVQMGSGPVTDGDSLALSGGTVEIGGSGQYAVYAITDGSVDLVLSGGAQAGPAGSKAFYNTVGAPTALLSITQIEGSGPVAFNANVSTGDFTTLANASFGPMTLTASGTVQLGSNPAGSDTASLIGSSTWTGAATYDIYAPLSGNYNLSLDGAGNKTFYTAVGGGGPASAIGTGSGAALTQNGSGAVIFQSTVRTASGITQADTAGELTFRGDVNSSAGNTATTLNANVTLDGLSWTSGGDIAIGSNAADTLSLSGDAVLITTAAANQDISLNARVTGAQNLSLSAGGGSASVNAALGFDAVNLPLALDISAAAINLDGVTIATAATQTYTGPVRLGADTTLSSTGSGAAGNISFSSTVDSDSLATARALTVNTAGTLLFGGAVGSLDALASLESDAPGSVTISGGSVITSGTQLWNDPVSLGADAGLSGSTVTFNAPVLGAGHSLAITGNAVFGDEGSDTATGFTTLAVSGITNINTSNISSSSTQSYGDTTGTDTITLGVNTTLSGSTVSFNAPLLGDGYSLEITGNAVFGDSTGDDTATGLASLNVSGTTNINTTAISAAGPHIYGDTTGTDTITLGADTNLTGSTILFNAPLVAAAHSLDIVGNAVFGDTTGDDTATGLSTLAVSGSTNINTTAISASGTQIYGDTVGTDTITLGSDTTLSGSSVSFNAPLVATAHSLDIIGNAVFGDATGDDTATGLSTLSVSGTTNINTTVISASGTQVYGDTVGTDTITLGSDTTLTGSTISFNAPLVAATHSLAIVGNAVFGDTSGDDTATGLSTLSVSGTTNINTTTISASGTQVYGDTTGIDTITLGADTTLSGSTVSFNAPLVAAAHSLDIVGNAVFGDTTGDDTATGLSTLSVSGTTNINTTSISASGTQVYGDTTGTDTITLGSDTTLTGSTVSFNAPLLAAGHSLDIVGNAVFGDSTGDDTLTGLTSLAISGSSAINTTAISSSAAQTYTGPVRLGANTTLSSTGSGAAGNISFSSTVDSDSVATARALTVNTAGTLLFGGAVGSLDALASLESDAPGSVTISGGSVITSGTQTWQDAVFITQNSLFQSAATSGTAIDFFSTLRSSGGSARSLEVDGNSAQVRFRGNLGNLTAIDSLASIEVRSSSSAPDALLLEASALSNGNQLWNAPLSFAAANNTDTVLAVGGELRFTQDVLHSNGIIEAGSGGIYFMADYLASSSGSDAPTLSGSSTDAIVISITGDMSLFNFTHFEDELLFNGSAVQLFDSNDQIIAAVRIANIGTDSGLRLSGSSVRQTGASRAIILESGWLDLATNDLGWLADSAAGGTPTADSFNGVVGSLTMSAGTELRCGGLVTESGYTVVHSGESTLLADGSVRFDGAMPNTVNSNLILSGSMVSLRAAIRVGNLTIRGSVILQSDIEMDYDMLIESGAFLDVSTSNFSIELDGHWTNLQGVTGFDAQAGEVRFTRAVTDGDIEIRGNNQWYRFVCEVAGQTIQFEQNRMQTFLVGGAFRVRGSSTTERITITRLSADQTSDLDWVPPTPPEASLMWQIDLLPGASLELLHVLVAYSDARAHAVAVNTDNDVELYTAANFIDNLGGETVMTCYKWLIGLLAAYSYTEDADGNGRIDRIRVTAAASLNQNFNDFEVMVQDYTIDQSKGTNGFEPITTGAFANYEFWIHLEEKTYLDTGARPRWSIIQNTSLRDGSTEKYMLINYPDQYIAGSGLYVQEPTDTAQPVLAWTLALPGMDQLYLCFSEPVFGSAAQPLASGDLQSPGAVSLSPIPAAHSTSTMAEYLVTLSAPLGISSILAGTQATLDALVNDNALAATDWSLDPSLDQFMPPPPYYPISQPVNRVLSNQHRVSDLMISLEPNMAEDNYFVWPIWAKDSVSTEIDELDYDTLSGDDAASQTIGLVRDFSSNRWLRDQDITMQVRVNPAFGAAVPELVFDSNVAAGYLATEENGPVGFWLPSFDMSDLNGLVPQPNTGTASENPSPAAASLFNYEINATHPKIFDKAMVNFFFRLNSAASDLYVGRLEGEASGDWYRRIRPFSFEIRDVVLQRGRVTILNNVINPLNGETVRLSYQLTRSGPVTIQVYTLDGELVEVLYRGSRSAGDYTAVWDGTNRGGRAVARGMYFIRVVAPGIDEIRKVLVVK